MSHDFSFYATLKRIKSMYAKACFLKRFAENTVEEFSSTRHDFIILVEKKICYNTLANFLKKLKSLTRSLSKN